MCEETSAGENSPEKNVRKGACKSHKGGRSGRRKVSVIVWSVMPPKVMHSLPMVLLEGGEMFKRRSLLESL